jgi:putative ABC transport system permease protein
VDLYHRIETLSLGLITLFVIAPLLVSAKLSLGIERRVLIATARCYGQLLLLGLFLGMIFEIAGFAEIMACYALMCAFAVHHILSAEPSYGKDLIVPTTAVIFLTGFLVTCIVTYFMLGISPWYDPRFFIPLGGMVLGNSMNGIAVAFHRYFQDIRLRKDEIREMLSLGASTWEAALGSIRSAIQAGLIPTINSASTAGIVWIPGMMTGQVLSGAPPFEAAKYQILVFLMILGSVSLGTIGCVLLSYKYPFRNPWCLGGEEDGQ